MNGRDIEKLLGGYATGTLTPEEREALFSEALGNQKLFDALADEEALRELLSDPATRKRLLAALEPAPARCWERFAAWVWRPVPLAAAGAVAMALIAVVVMREAQPVAENAQIAMVRPKESAAPAPARDEEPAGTKQEAAPETAPEPAPPSATFRRMEPPPPPPAMAPPPAAAPPPAPARETPRMLSAETAPPAEEKAQNRAARQDKDAVSTLAAAAPVAEQPFQYRLERLEPDGSYTTVAADQLKAGDSVRLVVDVAVSGRLVTSVGGPAQLSTPVNPGQRVYVPAQGFLPSGSGPLQVAMTWTASGNAPGAAGGVVGGFVPQGYMQSGSARSASAPYRVNLDLNFK